MCWIDSTIGRTILCGEDFLWAWTELWLDLMQSLWCRSSGEEDDCEANECEYGNAGEGASRIDQPIRWYWGTRTYHTHCEAGDGNTCKPVTPNSLWRGWKDVCGEPESESTRMRMRRKRKRWDVTTVNLFLGRKWKRWKRWKAGKQERERQRERLLM